MPAVLLSVVKILVFVYVGLCLLLFVRQKSFVYFPTPAISMTPADVGLDFEDLMMKTGDGESIHAWHIPAPGGEHTVLFCHGNAGNIGDRMDSVLLFHELGLHVLIFDYRGYGKSSGRPTEQGTYQDITAAWEYLVTDRGVEPKSVLVFGRSLGAGVATWLARNRDPGGLIVESAFTSVPDMGAHIYPYLPVRLLCRISYDNIGRMPGISCPVLVIHSRHDEMIPFSHAERLFRAANEPKRFHALDGGHNTAVFDETYRAVIREFARSSKP